MYIEKYRCTLYSALTVGRYPYVRFSPHQERWHADPAVDPSWRAVGGMAEAGLENIEEGMLGSRMNFETFDDFWLPNLGKQGPIADYLDTLEPDEYDSLYHHVRQSYLSGEEDGPRSFAAVAWAVKGTVPLA